MLKSFAEMSRLVVCQSANGRLVKVPFIKGANVQTLDFATRIERGYLPIGLSVSLKRKAGPFHDFKEFLKSSNVAENGEGLVERKDEMLFSEVIWRFEKLPGSVQEYFRTSATVAASSWLSKIFNQLGIVTMRADPESFKDEHIVMTFWKDLDYANIEQTEELVLNDLDIERLEKLLKVLTVLKSDLELSLPICRLMKRILVKAKNLGILAVDLKGQLLRFNEIHREIKSVTPNVETAINTVEAKLNSLKANQSFND